MTANDPTSQQPSSPMTSVHVRRAMGGDEASLQWLVAHLTPMLLAQAAYRMGPHLRRNCEPEDVVNEAWLVALPRLASLPTVDRRATPVLLRFLSTTILFIIRNLARKQARSPMAPTRTPSAVDNAAANVSGVITKVVRGELRQDVRAMIESLDPADREILVLRGIEQQPLPTIAAQLDVTVDAAAKRYQRALARLRTHLPGSVIEELEDQ
jgi:RNA polymerase sigma factor (sigma-70 family)